MKTKHNLFAVVEKESNIAIALVDSPLQGYFELTMPLFNVLPVANTGTSSHRTDKGTITSMSIWIDSEKEPVYHIITDWPDSISIGEAYKLIK